MEYPAKMMSQHFTSMLEHLKVSSLINKTRNNQASSSSTNNTSSNEKERHNSIDQTDNSTVSSPLLHNRSNVLVMQNHKRVSDGDGSEKLLSNNPNGINVNCNNQIQENGTKAKEENNVGTMSECNDINTSVRQVTNINNSSCAKSNNPGIEIVPPSSMNCNVGMGGSMGCPIMGLQQQQQHQQQRKQSFVIKPIKLKNVITQAETYDTLYTRATEVSNESKKLYLDQC